MLLNEFSFKPIKPAPFKRVFNKVNETDMAPPTKPACIVSQLVSLFIYWQTKRHLVLLLSAFIMRHFELC